MHISLLHSIVDLKKYKEYLLIQLSQENIESNFLYANMETWIHESLSSLLDFPVPDDMIKYVLSIENNKELEEYMKTLLNFDDPKHKGFFLEFVNKRFSRGRPQGQNSQKKKISKNKENKPAEYITKADVPPTMEQGQTETNKSKKKAKFVNLYSQDGQNAQVVFLKGRHHCDCQASKHPLINNCTNCGRIVCKQEGSGPCLFCGNLVCTPEEQKEVNSKSKAGAKLMETLMEKKRPKGWEAALAHRNRLLEYDRTSERRTHVTDDDSDYFKSNSVWLSAAEREKLEQYQRSVQEKRHASRLSKKMTFDFGGRRIVEDEDAGFEVGENKINEITNSDRGAGGGERRDLWSGAAGDRDVAPGVNAPLLAFDPSVVVEARARHPGSGGGGVGGARVQDGGIQEMVDAGKCLSMHQPWASLLVEGIKMHEGRTWYSSHRGRLWIASTVKPPEQDTVHSLEAMYRAIHQDEGLVFPSFYPTGCLLGCVNVDDCLPQEEYQKIYPGGESDSPYVFICSNPTSLRLRFPVKGQHKIYNLDKTIHQAAVKFMLKSAKQSADA